MDILDTGLTKWGVLFFAILLVKVWPAISSLDWYWYLLVAVVFSIRPIYHFLLKK